MKIYLIRHGETEWNNDSRYQGSIDIELDDNGLEQADAIGKAVVDYNIEQVYTSDLKRAYKTANIINSYINKEIVVKESLREINLGDWEGKTWQDIKLEYKEYVTEWLKNISSTPSLNGESYVDLENRVMTELNDIVKSDYENIAIVTHGAVIKTIICSILGLNLDNRSNFEIDNGSISVLNYNKKKNKFKVSYMNSTSHFDK